MIFKSPLISVGSGKIAGNVITRGRGNSLVMRKLSVPVNPNTPSQSANRSLFAGLAGAWTTVLTASQRLAWEGYAGSVTVINKLGDAAHLAGIAMYIRNNQARLAAAPTGNVLGASPLPRIDDAPAIHTLSSPPDLTAVIAKTNAPFGITGDVPVPEVGTTGALALRVSKPQNASRNFFKGPFTALGVLPYSDVDSVIDTTTGLSLLEDAVGTLVEGQTIFLQASLMLDDGRTSNPTVKAITVGPTS